MTYHSYLQMDANGRNTQEDLPGLILKKSLQKTVQEFLWQGIDKKLGRSCCERRDENISGEVYHNGYATRKLKTAGDKIDN